MEKVYKDIVGDMINVEVDAGGGFVLFGLEYVDKCDIAYGKFTIEQVRDMLEWMREEVRDA